MVCEGGQETLLRKLDHTGIFLLIAGTYVPVCLLTLPHSYGWVFLGFQTLLALIGVLGTFRLRRFPEVLNVVLYLLMGWMALPAVAGSAFTGRPLQSFYWPPVELCILLEP